MSKMLTRVDSAFSFIEVDEAEEKDVAVLTMSTGLTSSIVRVDVYDLLETLMEGSPAFVMALGHTVRDIIVEHLAKD